MLRAIIGLTRYSAINLMAFITNRRRYHPKIEWSSGSWTHNVFRAYEWLFGREYGVRREMAIEQVLENGVEKTYRYFFTKEAAIAHMEGVVRQFFRNEFSFKKVQVCVPAFEGKQQGMFGAFDGQYVFAIARNDTENDLGAGGSATRTVQMSITGSDRVLAFFPYNDVAARTVSAKTYAGVDFGAIVGTQNDSTNGTMRTYLLVAPSTTAASNLTLTLNSSSYIALGAIAYTGAAQTGQSLAVGTNQNPAAGTSITASISVVQSNAWIAGRARFDNGGTITATNDFAFVSFNVNGLAILDSNTIVATGSRTVGASSTVSGARWINSLEIDPPGAGPANVKTFDGVTQSSGIKTYMGIATASVKSVNGVS